MKVHIFTSDRLSQAMFRVERALQTHVPAGVSFVKTESSADLWVIPVVGWDAAEKVDLALQAGIPYVLIQYCFRTTQRPTIGDWLPLWRGAKLVWSYYDLNRLALAEKVTSSFPFYHSPLGVDANVFQAAPAAGLRTYGLFTSGYVAETESVWEAVAACERTGRKMFHLGPNLGWRAQHVSCAHGITDFELCTYYAQSEYVCGLRRIEGFELPAAEGLLCGARPIVFDKPHYTDWFGGLAEVIVEGDYAHVSDQLVQLLRQGAHPVSASQRAEAVRRFDWKTICGGFWERLV